jgi:hypothetical protein
MTSSRRIIVNKLPGYTAEVNKFSCDIFGIGYRADRPLVHRVVGPYSGVDLKSAMRDSSFPAPIAMLSDCGKENPLLKEAT